MTSIISKEQLANAATILNSSGPVEFYKYLSDNGLKYATLAHGVASESSLSATSIGYLIEAAHDGGVDLTDDQVETIKVGMANKYLDVLRDISGKDPAGNVNRDINFDEAELFHRELFLDYNLPSDTWAMKIIYDVLPVEARNAYWEQALLSAGDFYYESVFTLATVYLMGQQTLISEHSAQAWTWINRIASVPVAEEAGGVGAHSLMDMMIVLANMPRLLLPGVTNHVLDRSLGMKAYDPLVLDLDGDGIETLGVQDGVKFDFDGDDIKTGTGWIAKNDGILVFDRNGNSTIDNGSELFGIDTIKRNGEKALDGLDAIRDLDSNGDGTFDAADTDFGSVLVWQDLNGNGISEAGEMKSLRDLGIKSIGLTGNPINVDSNGNMLSAIGEFIRYDGTSGLVGSDIQNSYNINFATNNFLSEFTEIIPPNHDFDDIPKIAGSGKVRNLYEASILDEQLATQVRDFMVMASDGKGAPLMDGILARWASTGNSKSIEERFEEAGGLQTGFTLDLKDLNQSLDSTLGNDFLGKLLILEKFIGNDLLTFTIDTNGNTQHLAVEVYGNQFHFYNDSSSTMIIVADDLKNQSIQQSVDQIYQQLFTDTYLSLSVSALFDSYLQDMKVGIKDGTIHYNFEDVGAALSLESLDNPLKVIRIAIDLATFYGDTDGTLTALIARLAANMPETELAKIGPLPVGMIFTDKLIDKSLIAFDKNIVIGGEQDLLRGISGDDNISTWNTNDVIFAGTDDDTIRSAGGLDTYVFARIVEMTISTFHLTMTMPMTK